VEAGRKESTSTQWSAISDETTPALNNTPTQQYTPDNTITSGNELPPEYVLFLNTKTLCRGLYT